MGARLGRGLGANRSGDIFLPFSTGNRAFPGAPASPFPMIGPDQITSLLQAAEATMEAAIQTAVVPTTENRITAEMPRVGSVDKLSPVALLFGVSFRRTSTTDSPIPIGVTIDGG